MAPDDPRHGTTNGYTNLKCRCDRCCEAKSTYAEKQRKERNARLAADPSVTTHGNSSAYTNWGCRCAECRAFAAVKRQQKSAS